MQIDTIKFENKGNIKMIAHRGLSGLERENTCPAFVAAGVKSYYGIETDVHITADKKYIIVHDDDLRRIAGLDLIIRETDFDTLRSVSLTDRDGVTQRKDLFLPTLDEYLSICKKYSKAAVLELKEQMCEKDIVGIAEAVESAGMLASTTFISFCPENLLFLHKHYPYTSAQFLSTNTDENIVKFILENNLDADILGSSITPEFVEIMHANGKLVNAWTIDNLEDAEKLRDCGVDMITSNILE